MNVRNLSFVQLPFIISHVINPSIVSAGNIVYLMSCKNTTFLVAIWLENEYPKFLDKVLSSLELSSKKISCSG